MGDIPILGDPVRDLTVWYSDRVRDANRAALDNLRGQLLTPIDPLADTVTRTLYGPMVLITIPLLTFGGLILGYLIMVSRTSGETAYAARSVAIVWPTEGRISQRFGPTSFTGEPPLCYEGTCYAHFHDGLDIAAPVGTPVVAMAAGRVTLAGRVADGAVVVMIDHRNRVSTLYGHLEPALAVRDGDTVVAGQLLGTVGLTGHTTGPHLHLELWNGAKPIDPLTLLPPRP